MLKLPKLLFNLTVTYKLLSFVLTHIQILVLQCKDVDANVI